jgi:two-component system, cell cycle response regulator
MDAVVRLCPAASVAVYLHERLDGQNTLHNVGHRHFASGPPSSLALVDDSTWLCRAVQQGAVLPHVALLKAPARGLFTANDNACDAADARCFPLLARGEVVGALVVALIHVDDNARLRAPIIDACTALADVLAVTFEASRAVTALEKQATTDGLTGLVNRRTMDRTLDDMLARARRSGGPLSVVLCDIDHFKSVNDVYGHGTGDDVLKAVAKAMSSVARNTDVVARYGGEELCVLCEHTDVDGAAVVAEKLRRAVHAVLLQTEKGPLSVTSSFGVAALHSDDTRASLFHRADTAMYAAKAAGRNCVKVSP